MKIGDVVKGIDGDLEGTIQDIAPCHKRGCYEISITLDPEGEGVRWYYHKKSFVLVRSAEEKVS